MANRGLICFTNDSGLGAQTRRMAHFIKPERILAINAIFSKNKQHHLEWYDGFSGYTVNGFPNNTEINAFINGLTHVIVAENPLNFYLLDECKRRNIKLYIQSNYEFCDHLDKKLTLPTKFLMPSYWHIDTMKGLFGDDRVDYLPPPIDPNEFKEARKINLNRSGKTRFLHIVGTLAENDRNGTLDLLDSLPHTTSDFELVIRSQHDLPSHYMRNDKQLKYIIENSSDNQSMYKDFDALILPRRYGGLSLTTNEALMSGLPVFMTNISPNNQLLPSDWLFDSSVSKQIYTRTLIDVYKTDQKVLAQKIDWYTAEDKQRHKINAFELGFNQFSFSNLQARYYQLWK